MVVLCDVAVLGLCGVWLDGGLQVMGPLQLAARGICLPCALRHSQACLLATPVATQESCCWEHHHQIQAPSSMFAVQIPPVAVEEQLRSRYIVVGSRRRCCVVGASRTAVGAHAAVASHALHQQ